MLTDDVFEAIMVCAGACVSTSLNVAFFSSGFSGTASMTRSALCNASLRSIVGQIRTSVSFICCSVIWFLLTNFRRLLRTMSMPLSMKRCSMSRMLTSYSPTWAATCVMPCPIKPAPKTAIFLISANLYTPFLR